MYKTNNDARVVDLYARLIRVMILKSGQFFSFLLICLSLKDLQASVDRVNLFIMQRLSNVYTLCIRY